MGGSAAVEVPRELSSFARVIMLNQRGMGLSDPIPLDDSITAEDWIDDVQSVMDAVGAERISIIGTGTAGTVAMLFAATQPDRASCLVLVNSTARTAAADGYPFGSTPELRASMHDLMAEAWGGPPSCPCSRPSSLTTTSSASGTDDSSGSPRARGWRSPRSG